MADFRTITDTISYRSENQFVCSVSDKLDGFLHRAHEFEFSNLWLVASPGDQKRLRQARQEDSVRNEAKYRNFFCRSVAEQQQLILCHIKFAGRKFNQ
jgi:hypothetical protein